MSISRRGFVKALSALPFAGLFAREAVAAVQSPEPPMTATEVDLTLYPPSTDHGIYGRGYTGYEIVGHTSRDEPTRENRYFYEGKPI